jgi:hypothetical protein
MGLLYLYLYPRLRKWEGLKRGDIVPRNLKALLRSAVIISKTDQSNYKDQSSPSCMSSHVQDWCLLNLTDNTKQNRIVAMFVIVGLQISIQQQWTVMFIHASPRVTPRVTCVIAIFRYLLLSNRKIKKLRADAIFLLTFHKNVT